MHPPIGRKNTTYILPSGGLYATYHLLGEPETTIENSLCLGWSWDENGTVDGSEIPFPTHRKDVS